LSTYKLPLKGKKPLQTLKYALKGPGANPDRQDAPHPHHAFVDPTGRFLLVTDLGADVIRINKINKKTGKLTECPPAVAARGSGPRHGAFWTPNRASSRVNRVKGKGEGIMLFVTNELSNTVAGWKVTYPSRGCLTLKQQQSLTAYKGNVSAPINSTLAEIRIKDNFLYTSNRVDKKFAPNDSITQYTISDKGVLSWTDITSSHGTVPRTFEINKAGDYVAIGNQLSENVAIVARNPATGKLGKRVADLKISSQKEANANEDIPTGLTAVVWAE
jgi:6-phosphogluconolactonase (cycloisomerase 2 family)